MEKQSRLFYYFSWFPWVLLWLIGIKSLVLGFEFIWVKHTGLSALITATALFGFISSLLLLVMFAYHLSYLIEDFKKNKIKTKIPFIIAILISLATLIMFSFILEIDFSSIEGILSSIALSLLFNLIYIWPFLAAYLKYASSKK